MGGTALSSLRMAPDGTARGSAPCLSADAAFAAATRPSGDRTTQSAASSAVAKPPRRTDLPPRLTRA
eukprot:scaffold115182_cov45-Phaeocystis_antarctica.AAC.3